MISRSEDKKFFLAETRRSATSAYEVVMRGYSAGELPRTIIPRAVFSSEGQRKELPVRMLSKKIGPAEAHRRNGETISWMLCFIGGIQRDSNYITACHYFFKISEKTHFGDCMKRRLFCF